MKILIPVLGFTWHGGMRVLSQFGTHWTRAGHDVRFIANIRSAPPYHPTLASTIWVDDEGWETRPKPATDTHESLILFRTMRSLLRGLEHYGRDADIVLANYCFTAWPVFFSRLATKKIYYIQAYEPEFFTGNPGLRGVALRLLSMSTYLLPMRRIVNSPLYFKYKLLRAKEWVSCGIDLNVMKPANQTRIPQWGERRIVIGTIGRKEPHKGTAEALAAVDILLKRGRDVELQVAYGNLPNVVLPDTRLRVVVPRNDAELADYYRSLDVLVAAARIQPGAVHYPVLEGMACGIPVITTGHMPADRQRENAWFVPVNDAEAIANSIETIFSDPVTAELRVRRGLDDVASYAWDHVAGKLATLMESQARRQKTSLYVL